MTWSPMPSAIARRKFPFSLKRLQPLWRIFALSSISRTSAAISASSSFMRRKTPVAASRKPFRKSQRGLSGRKNTPANMMAAGMAIIPSMIRQCPPVVPSKVA